MSRTRDGSLHTEARRLCGGLSCDAVSSLHPFGCGIVTIRFAAKRPFLHSLPAGRPSGRGFPGERVNPREYSTLCEGTYSRSIPSRDRDRLASAKQGRPRRTACGVECSARALQATSSPTFLFSVLSSVRPPVRLVVFDILSREQRICPRASRVYNAVRAAAFPLCHT